MSTEWQADLRLKLEDLVDKSVVDGAAHEEVLRTLRLEADRLIFAYEQDPDPADDGSVIDEPANDWPAAT